MGLQIEIKSRQDGSAAGGAEHDPDSGIEHVLS